MKNIFLPHTLNETIPFHVVAIGEREEECYVEREGEYLGYHLMLSKKGKGKLILDHKEYTIEEGTVFLIEKGKKHIYYPISSQWHTAWIIFKDDSGTLFRICKNNPIFPPLVGDTYKNYFTMIYDEATKGTIRSVRNTSAMLYQLIIKITNQFYDQDDDSSDIKTKVLSFINDNYSKNIGLEEIAQFVGISKQHLCRVFKANFHTTPYEYLTLYRLKKAKEKLTNTSLTINKISQQTGFHDSSYFCQVFKKYENLSPQKFRELFY